MDISTERIFQEKNNKHAFDLNSYMKAHAQVSISTDPDINIVDTLGPRFYKLNTANLDGFYTLIEKARIDSAHTTYAEFQKPISGICITIIVRQTIAAAGPRQQYQNLGRVSTLIATTALARLYTGDGSDGNPAVARPDAIEVHVKQNKTQSGNQDWLQFIMPDIHVNQAFKTELVNELMGPLSTELHACFCKTTKYAPSPVASVEVYDMCIVEPVYLLGASDRPFELVDLFIITNNCCESIKLPPTFNKARACSILYGDAPQSFIPPSIQADVVVAAPCKIDLLSQIIDYNDDHIESDILQIKIALDILEHGRYDHEIWSRIINVLALSSAQSPVEAAHRDPYAILAAWYTSEGPFTAAAMTTIWDESVMVVGSPTKRHILSMARARDAMAYHAAIMALVADKLYYFAIRYDGNIQNGMMSTLITLALYDRYIVDVAPDNSKTGSAHDYCWYEFVLPGSTATPGSMYKWRRETTPDGMFLYLRYKFDPIFRRVEARLREKEVSPKTIKEFRSSGAQPFSQAYTAAVVRSAVYNFRHRGFAASLDSMGELMGVGNGILQLRSIAGITPISDAVFVPRLIDGFHEFPVASYSVTNYKPMDLCDPVTAQLMAALQDIYTEPDAFLFIMMYFASSLDGITKAARVLFLYGVGANGKSFSMELMIATLGASFAKKVPLAILTGAREESSSHNSALMALKGTRFGYFSEPQKAEIVNTGRLKEITGQETQSGRDLNSKQENFKVVSNLVCASNHELVINCFDHGIWRRVMCYWCKTKFVSNPDPRNVYEKRKNRNFLEKYINEPAYKQAFLGILVHFYIIFHREYDGDMDRVPCATIERETEIYRNKMDHLNRYITENIRSAPGATPITIDELVNKYIYWLTPKIGGGVGKQSIPARGDVLDQLANSKLSTYIRVVNGFTVLTGNIILSAEESAAEIAAVIAAMV